MKSSLTNKVMTLAFSHVPFNTYFRYNERWWHKIPLTEGIYNAVDDSGYRTVICAYRLVALHIDNVPKTIAQFAKKLC